MTPDVVKVKPLPDYCLETAFSALTEQNPFMKAYIAYGTVVWNDEIDLSPDTLYLRGRPL
jgi:hypothetical protein